MASTGEGSTASDYIVHHLGHFTTTGKPQESILDFSVMNIDTLFFSILSGIIVLLILRRASKKATSGVPGRFQGFVELLVEMADGHAKAFIHGNRQFIAPLALTIFCWVVVMNAFDLIPVDLIPSLWANGITAAGTVETPQDAYMRVVATADINGTMGLALGVLLLMIYYSIKIKGLGGFIKELFCAPFGAFPLLWPFNFMLNIIELISKTVSLGMRLFGNMYAGELVFMLIALLGGMATLTLGGALAFVGHLIAGSLWAIFHILIITLQAYIFMTLSLIYLGQSHDEH